jgi:hypothetical protein
MAETKHEAPRREAQDLKEVVAEQALELRDVYFGRGQTILLQRERIKRDTIRQRRLQHQSKAA